MPPVEELQPPIKMFRGSNLSGLGCVPCTTAPQGGEDYYPGGSQGAPGQAGAAGANGAGLDFDLSAIPDWLKYGAIALAVYFLLKKK
jgi:hypothetical protein